MAQEDSPSTSGKIAFDLFGALTRRIDDKPTIKQAGPRLRKRKTLAIRDHAYLSLDEFKEIDQAAKAAGMMRGKWIRTKLLAAARRA